MARRLSLLMMMLAACVAMATSLAPTSSFAQGRSTDLNALAQRVQALTVAGRFAEAVPLAEQLVKLAEASR